MAAQVVVLNSRWAQREEFIDAVRAAVDAAPARAAGRGPTSVRRDRWGAAP